MNLDDLNKRITRLEDIEAIKQLKARYCEICDDNHNPDRITSVFSEDAIWEGRGIGKAEGHAAIRELFAGFQKMMSFTQHMVVNPVIEIDGDTRQRHLVFLWSVHVRRRQSGEVADRALSRGLSKGERRLEDQTPARQRSRA